MNKQLNIKLDLNNENNKVLTFKELYEHMKKEIETYDKLDMLDELMEQEILFNIYDSEGRIVYSKGQDFIGWLEGGTVMITGNIEGFMDIE